MQIQVSYLRTIEVDGKQHVQNVTRSIEIDEPGDIAQVRQFFVRYPWDPEHPLVFEPVKPYFPW